MSKHEEETELNRQVELIALLEGLYKLEAEIKSQYWAYSELNEPKQYDFSLPMDVEGVRRLLKYMYSLLYHLNDFLKRTHAYQYYQKYIQKYFQELEPYARYYDFHYPYENYLKEKQLSSFNETKLIKDAELLAEISGDKSLIEKAKRKVEWSKLSTKQKLHKLIDDWYEEFMRKKKELSKQSESGYIIERVSRNYWRLKKR